MRHPWNYRPRAAPSIAGAMRARGVARALGQLPQAFNMGATVLTPATRRLGGVGGLGLLDPMLAQRVAEQWQPSWGVPMQSGTPRLTSPDEPLPGDPVPSSPPPSAPNYAEAVPSLERQRVGMVTEAGHVVPAIIDQQAQPTASVQTQITPVPPTASPADITPPTGVPTASVRVAEAHAGNQNIPVAPGATQAPDPDVHVPNVVEIPYGDDTITAGPIQPGVARTTSHGSGLPFGWPWWAWAIVAAATATGIYALTRR